MAWRRAGDSGGPASRPWGDRSQQRAEGVRGGGGPVSEGTGLRHSGRHPRGRRGCLCPGGFGEQVGPPGARGWTCRSHPLGGSCRPSHGQRAGADVLLRGAWEPVGTWPGVSSLCPDAPWVLRPFTNTAHRAEGRTSPGACGDVAPTASGGHVQSQRTGTPGSMLVHTALGTERTRRDPGQWGELGHSPQNSPQSPQLKPRPHSSSRAVTDPHQLLPTRARTLGPRPGGPLVHGRS